MIFALIIALVLVAVIGGVVVHPLFLFLLLLALLLLVSVERRGP